MKKLLPLMILLLSISFVSAEVILTPAESAVGSAQANEAVNVGNYVKVGNDRGNLYRYYMSFDVPNDVDGQPMLYAHLELYRGWGTDRSGEYEVVPVVAWEALSWVNQPETLASGVVGEWDGRYLSFDATSFVEQGYTHFMIKKVNEAEQKYNEFNTAAYWDEERKPSLVLLNHDDFGYDLEMFDISVEPGEVEVLEPYIVTMTVRNNRDVEVLPDFYQIYAEYNGQREVLETNPFIIPANGVGIFFVFGAWEAEDAGEQDLTFGVSLVEPFFDPNENNNAETVTFTVNEPEEPQGDLPPVEDPDEEPEEDPDEGSGGGNGGQGNDGNNDNQGNEDGEATISANDKGKMFEFTSTYPARYCSAALYAPDGSHYGWSCPQTFRDGKYILRFSKLLDWEENPFGEWKLIMDWGAGAGTIWEHPRVEKKFLFEKNDAIPPDPFSLKVGGDSVTLSSGVSMQYKCSARWIDPAGKNYPTECPQGWRSDFRYPRYFYDFVKISALPYGSWTYRMKIGRGTEFQKSFTLTREMLEPDASIDISFNKAKERIQVKPTYGHEACQVKIYSPDGNFLDSGNCWGTKYIYFRDMQKASEPYGKWKAKLIADGSVKKVEYFYVTEANMPLKGKITKRYVDGSKGYMTFTSTFPRHSCQAYLIPPGASNMKFKKVCVFQNGELRIPYSDVGTLTPKPIYGDWTYQMEMAGRKHSVQFTFSDHMYKEEKPNTGAYQPGAPQPSVALRPDRYVESPRTNIQYSGNRGVNDLFNGIWGFIVRFIQGITSWF